MYKIEMLLFALLMIVGLFLSACNQGNHTSVVIEEPVPATDYNTSNEYDYYIETPATQDEVLVFPSLYIEADGEPFVERETWIDSTFTLTDTSEILEFEGVEGRIRGRGNSTWRDSNEKRPLRIRFDDARSVLGADAVSRNWILLTNHYDGSLMRNHAAFNFASLLDGLDWTPSSFFVHLYVNGGYMGVFQLTDEREAHPKRISVSESPDPAVSEYIIVLNRHSAVDDSLTEGVDFFNIGLRTYDYRWPPVDEGSGHVEYVQSFMHMVDETIQSQDFSAISKVIDVDSFVDSYIVHELFCPVGVGWFCQITSTQLKFCTCLQQLW